MGTSRRTILTLLSLILPTATLASVSAQASTQAHVHATKAALNAKAATHHAGRKTAALHTHVKHPAG